MFSFGKKFPRWRRKEEVETTRLKEEEIELRRAGGAVARRVLRSRWGNGQPCSRPHASHRSPFHVDGDESMAASTSVVSDGPLSILGSAPRRNRTCPSFSRRSLRDLTGHLAPASSCSLETRRKRWESGGLHLQPTRRRPYSPVSSIPIVVVLSPSLLVFLPTHSLTLT